MSGLIPLALFFLVFTMAYVGATQVAFSALMRLPLRLSAERGERLERVGSLGYYLDNPLRLFMPARIIQAFVVALLTVLIVVEFGPPTATSIAPIVVGVGLSVLLFGHVVPILVVRRNPERALEMLLPLFRVVVQLLTPVTGPLLALLTGAGRDRLDASPAGTILSAANSNTPNEATVDVDEREERELLHSVVEFGETLVREVMTPRPDIVAVKSTATLTELRGVFAEQQYSRIPVYRESLDDILGFVFVKDLVAVLGEPNVSIIEQLMRPAYVVPEAKRVAELLKEFQEKQLQSAIVHDEYGGTAGLVTIEDLLEEIVGEIRDEYDVESEPIVDEGNGNFVFGGTVGVDDVSSRLDVEIERQGFATVGGYLLSRFGRVPRVGETLSVDGLWVEILEAESRRVQRVRMRRQDESVEP